MSGRDSPIRTKVVGVTYDNFFWPHDRQQIIARYVEVGTPVKLEWDPSNSFDENAVEVLVEALVEDPSDIFEEEEPSWQWLQIGYLSEYRAAELIDAIRAGKVETVEITAVTGGGRGKNYGVNLAITLTPR